MGQASRKRSVRTKTRAFGTSKREAHDSSPFYNSKLYSELDKVTEATPAQPDTPEAGEPASRVLRSRTPQSRTETPVPVHVLDQVFCKDSRDMSELPDRSIHLMVTSPPYNVGKEYDENLSLEEYLGLLRDVFRETHRVLVVGGRACINVANLGRKPYIPLHSYIISEMQSIGFLMRGEIIWDKAASSGTSTAWGSWMSPSNPTLRDVHEYILVFSKDSFSRSPGEGKTVSGERSPRAADDAETSAVSGAKALAQLARKESTITRDEFLEYTKSIWTFPTESARRVGHPAPFPVELPLRLIQLYTFRGDVVLDPFCGSGSTCVAAKRSGRLYVGYDIDETYVERARQRVGGQAATLPSQPELFSM